MLLKLTVFELLHQYSLYIYIYIYIIVDQGGVRGVNLVQLYIFRVSPSSVAKETTNYNDNWEKQINYKYLGLTLKV
jgi:hypothetical protein